MVPRARRQGPGRHRSPRLGAEAFERLRAANGNRLAGFFDVFAWRHPGEFWFGEVKVGKDKLQQSQREFIDLALRFHQPEQFTIIDVPG
ncbi:MAG TPA: VRR-NUC domain-containing protein [Streptosporangiaceae bacterium]|nr:VRR-NUC domain-containing protein [Streptosporangiaceae bacterium]